MRLLLDSYDSLIAPNLAHPPNSSQSSITLRRFLYRKLFYIEASALVQSSVVPVASIDQVVGIFNAACAKLNIFLS